jgi:hypothetical protein
MSKCQRGSRRQGVEITGLAHLRIRWRVDEHNERTFSLPAPEVGEVISPTQKRSGFRIQCYPMVMVLTRVRAPEPLDHRVTLCSR